MSVAILVPSGGDTISSPVTVTYSYVINAVAQFFTTVGSARDSGKNIPFTPPAPNSGTEDSGSITVSVSQPTEVAISVYGGDQGSTPDMYVTVEASGDPPPVGDIEISQPEMGGGPGAGQKQKYKVDGQVPLGSTAAYVVCQAIEVTVGDPTTRAVVAAGAGSVKVAGNKLTWSVSLEFVQNAGSNYVARAFAYDMNQTLLGSLSAVFK
jgi:hypothetical protein